MNIIEQLKNNTSAFGLMSQKLQEVAKKIEANFGMRAFLILDIVTGRFRPSKGRFSRGLTYQLCKDYQCHHPDRRVLPNSQESECGWCGKFFPAPKLEPKMGWVEYPVTISEGSNVYQVSDLKSLLWPVIHRVGFAGIKYERPCPCILPNRGFCMIPPEPCGEHGPAKPVMVRFWEVKK